MLLLLAIFLPHPGPLQWRGSKKQIHGSQVLSAGEDLGEAKTLAGRLPF